MENDEPSPYKWVEEARVANTRLKAKYPIRAVINGRICYVWKDWIEHTRMWAHEDEEADLDEGKDHQEDPDMGGRT